MIDLFIDIYNINWQPFILSFKLAGIVTVILFVLSLPISWYLSQSISKIKPFFEAIFAMPIVLPPSVLGFYILYVLAPDSSIGEFFHTYFGINLVFTFTGLVIASCFYSLPFMIQPLQSGFEGLNKNMIEASFISKKSLLQTIFFVALPNMKQSLTTAIVITFAHTIGEFGIVLMIGGSIEGQTKVASIAIYEMVEVFDFKNAHLYSIVMTMMSFIVLMSVYIFNKRYIRVKY
jgi:molybdate transport system permease protein